MTALEMTNNLFRAYRAIVEIDLEENAVKMMGAYNLSKNLARLIEQLEKGRKLARSGGQTTTDATMVPKGIM